MSKSREPRSPGPLARTAWGCTSEAKQASLRDACFVCFQPEVDYAAAPPWSANAMLETALNVL